MAATTVQRTTTGFHEMEDEWTARFAGRTHSFGELGRRTCGDLVALIQDNEEERDHVALTLLSLNAGGDTIAGRVLLQAMLPKAQRLARTCAGLRDLPMDERRWIAAGAIWEAVQTYPLHRTRSVVGNVALNALAIITKLRPGPEANVDELDDLHLEQLVDEDAEDDGNPTSGNSTFHNLVRVLTWAVDSEVLTRAEVAILARMDLGEDHERAELAESLGVTHGTLVKRTWRIRTKLMTAVQSHVATFGRW